MEQTGMCGSPSHVQTDDGTYHPKCGACPEPVLPGQYYFVAGRRDPQDIDSDQTLMVHAHHFMSWPGIVLD